MGCRYGAHRRSCAAFVVLIVGIGGMSLIPGSNLRAQSASHPNPDNTSTLDLSNLQSQFRTIADRVAPSVVAISAAVSSPGDSDDVLRVDHMNGEKLETLLQTTTRTVGTGFVIDADGYILTNEHVIGDSVQVWITTDDRKVYPAVVIGSDPRSDLAVLKSPARNLKPVQFASADSVHRGDWAIALGNPYGMAGTGEMAMSVGIISAIDRSLPKLATQENRRYVDLIQTTAEINPGNSGGPLFDLQGEVMGISTAVIMPQKSTNGIGFALPINPELLDRVQELKEGQDIVYAYLGVMVLTPTTQQRHDAGVTEEAGVLIDSVEKGSPGAGVLQPGDMVLKVNDRPVNENNEFVDVVGQCSIAQPTRFAIRRGSRPLTMMVQLRRRELPSMAINRDNQRIRWRGMLLGPIPANWDFGQTPRPAHGLMILGIDPASTLAREGVRTGTIVTAIAGKPVNAVTDLQSIVNDTPAEQCSLEMEPQIRQVVVSGQ
jgi:serine protease Do